MTQNDVTLYYDVKLYIQKFPWNYHLKKKSSFKKSPSNIKRNIRYVFQYSIFKCKRGKIDNFYSLSQGKKVSINKF